MMKSQCIKCCLNSN